MSRVLAAEVFMTAHIAVTAAISGILAFATALLIFRPRPGAVLESVVLGALTAAVFLWRKSANLPQLNTDGLQGLSANDWLAPVLTFVWLSVYRLLRPPHDPIRFGRAVGAAAIIAFAINVITI
ncbi:MAG TPA: hypothetical protein VGI56_01905 [Galbitalea sp.]